MFSMGRGTILSTRFLLFFYFSANPSRLPGASSGWLIFLLTHLPAETVYLLHNWKFDHTWSKFQLPPPSPAILLTKRSIRSQEWKMEWSGVRWDRTCRKAPLQALTSLSVEHTGTGKLGMLCLPLVMENIASNLMMGPFWSVSLTIYEWNVPLPLFLLMLSHCR